ncbi:beta-ketoacyl-ACP synthase III [Nonomuraea polychroma]|uniref:beta-ketoacyl-ACP synthase III n=1 Tax=Nonomuraea polychroma TaxID=46176 RepID=UPI003D9079B0
MTGSRIVALGHYQPERSLTNDDLASMVDTSDEWIRGRVGIETRHIAEPDEPVDAMASNAAAKALASAGLAPEDIDLIVVATCTASVRSPNTAAQVARHLGMRAPAALDVNSVCSGFTHALATADHAIQASAATKALVIGAEKFTDYADWTDRSTCILPGDGAGAAVVTASPQRHISPVLWGSQPELGHTVLIGGGNDKFTQEGQAVYRWATTTLPALARQVCDLAGLTPDDLSAVVLHQGNLRIIESVVRRLGITNAVVARDISQSGNTSAASIPIALSELVEQRQVAPGSPVLLLGFGGGLCYAGQIIHCP